MENQLAEYIASKITTSSQISIVVNKDGFLSQEDTRQCLLACDVELIPCAGLDLRLRYELGDWRASHVCFVIQQETDVLPDIRENYGVLYFSLYQDVLRLFSEDVVRSGLSVRQVAFLFANRPNRLLNTYETNRMLADAEEMYGQDLTKQKKALEHIDYNWQDVETIANISENLCDAFKTDSYEQVAHEIAVINYNFQHFLDQYYGSYKTSSHVNRPKLVSKVLPHIAYKCGRDEKIALLVVDGMCYWQYLLLRPELVKLGMLPKDNMTFAWIPSITQLSRQAIFRGEVPVEHYSQNPSSEAQLWSEFWQSTKRGEKRVLYYDIAYYHGGIPIIDMPKSRLAVVNIELDEHMHHCHRYGDLYMLTQSWAKRYARDVQQLHQLGYRIFITADHGSVYAQPWRNLKQEEKNTLLRSSRGTRHLIYERPDYLQLFLQANPDIVPSLRLSDRYAVWKDSRSFKNDISITHGGSHFMEMIVPFIEIEP